MVLVVLNFCVNQMSGSDLQIKVKTYGVKLMADNSIIQVHFYGLNHIFHQYITLEWKIPGNQKVKKAAFSNPKRVLEMYMKDMKYKVIAICISYMFTYVKGVRYL